MIKLVRNNFETFFHKFNQFHGMFVFKGGIMDLRFQFYPWNSDLSLEEAKSSTKNWKYLNKMDLCLRERVAESAGLGIMKQF